jgi:4-nitrophenyl phosphatase
MPLSEIEAVVSDMDGVLWRGDTLLPGMVEFFTFLRERDIPFALATNNSGRHPAEYVQKLAKLGVPDVAQQQIITSGTATADYLKTQYPNGARLYVIGNPGLSWVLEEAGFTIADENVDAVVAGLDFNFTYEKARRATLLIRNHGAAFIGTNPDLTFPSPEGLLPGGGSVIGMIQIATDHEPVLIGKPKRAMFDVAVQRLGSSPAKTLMIGDRINTDIEGGQNVGLQTAMVLTGVSKRDDIADIEPDYIFEDLIILVKSWQLEV